MLTKEEIIEHLGLMQPVEYARMVYLKTSHYPRQSGRTMAMVIDALYKAQVHRVTIFVATSAVRHLVLRRIAEAIERLPDYTSHGIRVELIRGEDVYDRTRGLRDGEVFIDHYLV